MFASLCDSSFISHFTFLLLPLVHINWCNTEPYNNAFCVYIVCQSDEAGDIRLGSNGNDTRIEICFNGLWGSLCAGDTWDDVDATVACRELGYAIGGK